MNASDISPALEAIASKCHDYAILAEDMGGDFRLFPGWLAVEHAGYNGRLVRECIAGVLDTYQGCKWYRIPVIDVQDDGRL